jgi:hypothetical protein
VTDPCHHTGDITTYAKYLELGGETILEEIPESHRGHWLVCWDCGAVFTAKQMLELGWWPHLPASYVPRKRRREKTRSGQGSLLGEDGKG